MLNQNFPRMILRCYHNCALFTMTLLSMLAGVMGREVEWGLGVDGPMVSQLASWSIGCNGAQARVTVSCSQTRHLPLSMLLTTQGCKWYWPICEGNLTIGRGRLQWTSIPSKKSSNTPSHFMSQKLEESACADDPFGLSYSIAWFQTVKV